MDSGRHGRRGFLHAVTGSAVGCLAALPRTARSAPVAGSLAAGAAATDITPRLEVGLLMSSSAGRWEPFEGIRLPLHARALVVKRQQHRVALAALDLIGLADHAVGGIGPFKEKVAASAGRGIEPGQVVLASSHTHTAPESLALTDLYRQDVFREWADRLARQIGLAIRRAADQLRPCRLVVGTRAAPGLAVNRRIRTKGGIASVRRQLPPEVVLGPEGPTDNTLRVAALVDRSGDRVAMLVNFTAHPVLEMCIKQVSPDYPGEMSLELERRHPGCVALFLQGACGNINPPTMERSAANARRYGRRLAGLADGALEDPQSWEGGPLALRWETIELPSRSLDGRLEAEPLKTRIGAMRIGGVAWVFLPGEPFVEIALAIRKASPWKFTAVVGYAEDYIGYIPTDRAFRNGGYEIGPGRWSRVAPGSEAIVCREAIRLLDELRP